MKTIFVDDELWALKQLEESFRQERDIEIVGIFRDPQDALEFAAGNRVEFALLDVQM